MTGVLPGTPFDPLTTYAVLTDGSDAVTYMLGLLDEASGRARRRTEPGGWLFGHAFDRCTAQTTVNVVWAEDDHGRCVAAVHGAESFEALGPEPARLLHAAALTSLACAAAWGPRAWAAADASSRAAAAALWASGDEDGAVQSFAAAAAVAALGEGQAVAPWTLDELTRPVTCRLIPFGLIRPSPNHPSMRRQAAHDHLVQGIRDGSETPEWLSRVLRDVSAGRTREEVAGILDAAADRLRSGR